MMYRYEYQSSECGMVSSYGVHTREIAVYHLLQLFISNGYKLSEIVHHGRGFWTRNGVFLGHIVASELERGYTVEK